MNKEESMQQIETLIEAWQLDEADLNQTDINAIKKMFDKNKQLKEQLESSNLIKYLPNIAKLISSGEIPKEVYNKYLGNVPCGFMNEKDLIKWFLEKSDK